MHVSQSGGSVVEAEKLCVWGRAEVACLRQRRGNMHETERRLWP